MCGRYTRTGATSRYADKFRAQYNVNLKPEYNIAPSENILAARTAGDGHRELVLLRWGLIPRWSKEPKSAYSTINARAETVATKPAFRFAFQHHRCLIAADGFYEWKKTEHGKQPYYIFIKGHEPFAFAGLWEHWEGEGHQPINSATIIVTKANEAIEPIHDRMPVILPESAYDEWLDPAVTDKEHLQELLRPYSSESMDIYPVSTYVNSPEHDDERCIAKIA